MNDLSSTAAEARALGPWFHNIHLPDGTQTAGAHALGDFPAYKWREIRSSLPGDLDGWSALDIGCNAGYYSVELARLGARVKGIDLDPHYLQQAAWVAERFGLQHRISLELMQVYDLAQRDEQYDLVWFMGVLYHLRYPLLALDILSTKVKRLMVFQTLTMPGEAAAESPPDLPLSQRDRLQTPDWPKMAFIENRLAGDPTNWWAPDAGCVEAMLRSCGFKVIGRPGHEVYLCAPDPDRRAVIADWDRSEYLSAIGRDWQAALDAKVRMK